MLEDLGFVIQCDLCPATEATKSHDIEEALKKIRTETSWARLELKHDTGTSTRDLCPKCANELKDIIRA